ncbi:MAG: hypothetical protein NDI62_03395 [Burkholderiales bacterium]|nr:hypothetical protein [Burkholderiales bacterium]
MYIYLKEEALNNNSNQKLGTLEIITVGNEPLPYVRVPIDFDLIKNNEELKNFFVKATEYFYPVLKNTKRELGVYKFKKAIAVLSWFSYEDDKYLFKMETSSWEGIADIEELKLSILAGSIPPSDSHEKEQVKESKIKKFFSLWKERINNFQKTVMAFD